MNKILLLAGVVMLTVAVGLAWVVLSPGHPQMGVPSF
jgi:hypothetical protein